MTRDELTFRTALSRFVVGAIAVAMLPTFYPRTRPHLWIWIAYLTIAALEQILIRKRIGGGGARAVISGWVDIALITYTCHALGSLTTPMVSLYLLAGVVNALVTKPRVAWTLAIVGALSYDAIVWADVLGWLPFAPDAPEMAVLGAPPRADALMGTIFVTLFVPAGTAIVTALVGALEKREGALVIANEQLEQLSQRDPLTNLYNRRHLFSRISEELARVRRGHPLALVMIDLDRFKLVNDIQGHLRGDVLLKEIAIALCNTTRVTDIAGRYGGDEFVVVLTDTDLSAAQAVAERVTEAIREAAQRFDTARPVTASVGIAAASSSDTVASLLRRADENAYRAKESGGDRVAS